MTLNVALGTFKKTYLAVVTKIRAMVSFESSCSARTLG